MNMKYIFKYHNLILDLHGNLQVVYSVFSHLIIGVKCVTPSIRTISLFCYCVIQLFSLVYIIYAFCNLMIRKMHISRNSIKLIEFISILPGQISNNVFWCCVLILWSHMLWGWKVQLGRCYCHYLTMLDCFCNCMILHSEFHEKLEYLICKGIHLGWGIWK